MNKVSYELLYEEYINKQKPMWQIANEQGCAIGTIFKYIKKYNITTRIKMTENTKRKISQSHVGKPSPRKGVKLSDETKEKIRISKMGKYKINNKIGGHKKQRKDGYVMVYIPTHPNCTKDGYIMEHHLIMENKIGRYIKKDEVVHHKNHIRNDNRIENLELLSFKDHAKLHMIERHQRRRLLSIKSF